MPFVEVDIKKVIEDKRKSDPDFKKAWDESREEYRLIQSSETDPFGLCSRAASGMAQRRLRRCVIGQMIALRKSKKIDPDFKKAWDESREEYRLIQSSETDPFGLCSRAASGMAQRRLRRCVIGQMIALRKSKKITQKDLAKLTGSKQQVVSRVERKESSPSLRSFCNMLNVMGYELQIVERKN